MYFIWVFVCFIFFSQTNLLYEFMILYMLWFVLDFYKIVYVCKLLKLMSNYRLRLL